MYPMSLSEVERAEMGVAFALFGWDNSQFAPKSAVSFDGAWPKDADAPLGYDERDAKI